MKKAFFVVFLAALGCAAPQKLGLSRIQVCINAETGQPYYVTVPRASRGASVCADFEAPPADE